MYTGFKLDVRLNPGVPPAVILTLLKMLRKYEGHVDWPDHELFKSERFRFMLVSSSAYFPDEDKENSELQPCSGFFSGGAVWELKVSCSLKNYDDEISKFLDWVDPYVNQEDRGKKVGYFRYEESEKPTGIVFLPRE